MTKAAVLDFFGVVRALALATAATGLILIVGSIATSVLVHASMMANASVLMWGAVGMLALVGGILVALVCSLTRLLVARMRFASSAEHRA